MNKLPYQETIDLLANSQNILQVSHVNPDGDTLGSSLALKRVLKGKGKNVRSVCIDKPPQHYYFMPDIDTIEYDFEPSAWDLIVTVDCADLENMTGFYRQYPEFFKITPIVNIDHHPSNDHFGQVALVSPEAASASQIMFYLFQHMEVELDWAMATQLLTALYFDTGSFQHTNTTPEVLKIAAECKRSGGLHEQAAFELFIRKPFPLLKLWAIGLNKLKVDLNRGIAWVFITKSDLQSAQAGIKDLEGLITLVHGIPGVKITVLLSERENGTVKGSIRTVNGVDAAYYAGAFGGGGHHKAAGFSAKIVEEMTGIKVA